MKYLLDQYAEKAIGRVSVLSKDEQGPALKGGDKTP